MKNKNYFFTVVIFLIVIFGIYTYLTPLPLSIYIKWRGVGERLEDIKQVKIAGQVLNVDLAITPEAQAEGLSSRGTLDKNEGMLFVFPQPGRYPFWMKDMNFPLDIIWIGEDLKVVYIQKNALPESYPESFTPEKNAKYVLEVSEAFADKNNLKEGDSVLFTYR
jgi:hypothetical protein